MNEYRNLPVSRPGQPLAAPQEYSLMDGGGPEEPGDGAARLKRFLLAIRRYWWVIVAVMALGTGLTYLGSRDLPLEYVAEARFWFERSGGDEQVRGPIQSSQLLTSASAEQLLRSQSVLEPVVRERQMYLRHGGADADAMQGFSLDSVFQTGSFRAVVSDDGRAVELRTDEGDVLERRPVGSPVGAALGFRWTPPAEALAPGREIDFTVVSPWEAARSLGNRLVTQPSRDGNFLYLSYTHSNPVQAAEIVNQVSERFVEVATELKRAKLTELTAMLESQLSAAQNELANAEVELEDFQVRTITLPSEATPMAPGLDESRAPVMSAFFGLKVEHDVLQQHRNAIQRILNNLDTSGALSIDALSNVEAVRQSPELSQALGMLADKRAETRALLQQYTEEHVLVRRSMAEEQELEQQVIPSLARQLISDLDARIDALQSRVTTASGELQQIPTRSIEQARLRRSATVAEDIYNEVRQRYETARLAAETTTPDVQIMDRASVPLRPSRDPRTQYMVMGLAGSLALGLLMVFTVDRFDPRLRYVEQLTEEMGLYIIGAVPSLGRGRNRPEPGEDATLRAVEALRSIRLNLSYAYGAVGPMIVTITSPGSGDGKSFIASNLALSHADIGQRTLIIDGDTRRGRLNRVFDRPRTPGLTDYLAGDSDLDDIIQATKFPCVDIITSGSRRTDSPELLSSPRLGELLARIRPDYDVILIDSPPLGAGVDPLVLATMAGNMLLVMRTGTTNRMLAEAKLRILDRLPVRLLGAVVNGIDDVNAYQYYSYLPGYEAGAEEGEELQLPAAGR